MVFRKGDPRINRKGRPTGARTFREDFIDALRKLDKEKATEKKDAFIMLAVRKAYDKLDNGDGNDTLVITILNKVLPTLKDISGDIFADADIVIKLPEELE